MVLYSLILHTGDGKVDFVRGSPLIRTVCPCLFPVGHTIKFLLAKLKHFVTFAKKKKKKSPAATNRRTPSTCSSGPFYFQNLCDFFFFFNESVSMSPPHVSTSNVHAYILHTQPFDSDA